MTDQKLTEIAFDCGDVGEPSLHAVYRVPADANPATEAEAEALAVKAGTYPPHITAKSS